jgi:membrane-associated phospholipid phosphatase
MAPSAPEARSDRAAHARDAVSAALVAMVVAGQLITLGELLGVRWPPLPVTLPLAMGAGPLAVGAWRRRSAAPGPPYGRGVALAVPLWMLWAGLYYAVAALTGASRARVLPEGLVAHLPFVPAFASVYIGVHAFSVLPLVRATTDAALRRATIGYLAILAISVAVWLALPISFPRSLAPLGDGFGASALASIRGNDPPVNCLPSTHCAMVAHAAYRLRPEAGALAWWGALTAVLIAASTLLLRQHYVVDVVAGVALGLGAAWGADAWA